MKVVTYKSKQIMWNDSETKDIGIDWSTVHLGTHRYELTITFNPKWFSDILDMEKTYLDVIDKIIIKAHSTLELNGLCYFNYVKEYQSNGFPHMHGTLMFFNRLANSRLTNWEQFFQRLYGKTQIWYTGDKDKIHKNDHFEGPWSKYLLKDNPENYKSIRIEKWNRKSEFIEVDNLCYELENQDFDQNIKTL